MKPTVIAVLNQVLDREATSPIALDRVHHVGVSGVTALIAPGKSFAGSTTTPERRKSCAKHGA